ncbi:DUF4262 domain-containing protein [Streptomyces syringium]|uniref:DUF4262 domain-containing protein n=1 Tax=Streptomyces syringium TaxID=76729 RepID=UPI00342128D9
MTDDPFQCRCVLCHDYGDRDEADRADLAISEDVQQHGWHVVMVPEDETGPGFAHTIGLAHTHGANARRPGRGAAGRRTWVSMPSMRRVTPSASA